MFSLFFFNHQKARKTMQRPERNNHLRELFQDKEMADLRKENMELRKEFFSLLSMPEVDTQAVNLLKEKLTISQNELEVFTLNHFIKIRNEMSVDDARETFNRLGRAHTRNERVIIQKNKKRGEK
jgi:hypothetical protein